MIIDAPLPIISVNFATAVVGSFLITPPAIYDFGLGLFFVYFFSFDERVCMFFCDIFFFYFSVV